MERPRAGDGSAQVDNEKEGDMNDDPTAEREQGGKESTPAPCLIGGTKCKYPRCGCEGGPCD